MNAPVTRLSPLAPADLRARRRPVAVILVFVAELIWALIVATPVHAWISRVWGSHPSGDGVLWAPGGRDLMMWLGQQDAGLSVTVRSTMVLFMVGALVMQLPLGALIASLAFSRREADPDAEADARPRSPAVTTALRVAIGAFMPLCGVLALGALAAIVVIGLGGIASSALEHALAGSLGDARAFTLRLVTFALFLAVAAVIGVIVDLARAAIGREAGLAAANGTSAPGWSVMLRGVRVAFSVARRGLSRAITAWALRAALGIALLAIGYVAAQSLGGREGSALTALFVIHQLIVLSRVALRASWLARAVALIAPVQDAREQQASETAPTEDDAPSVATAADPS